MSNLIQELNSFFCEMNHDILDGFNEVSKKIVLRNKVSAFDSLSSNAHNMKVAAHNNDRDSFYYFRESYYILYKKINIALAHTEYALLLVALKHQGLRGKHLKYEALGRIWNHSPKF
jgi:hypothetical protein